MLESGHRPMVLLTGDVRPALDGHLGHGERARLLEDLAGAESVVIGDDIVLDREALDAAPALGIVARAGAGADHVDLEAVAEAGVRLVSPDELLRRAVDLPAGGAPAAFVYPERPGGVGVLGEVLVDAEVNIEHLAAVVRDKESGTAIAVLGTDGPVPAHPLHTLDTATVRVGAFRSFGAPVA
ncbi:hypothetical protein [Streptomyces sp. TRM68416]|uniref:hypothetical protein n=1 Tax=Streptomyces sp. TRM68416 TaxID=2758412 RepID=UPI001661CF82|nr:hypothetical protein [Streptomyces sp. TRM68416]MBD0843040.1 hypothetical protein [Streptomyces sp. TRM68416]